MSKSKKPAAVSTTAYRVVRLFEGKRTAAQVVADLVKVHNVT